MLNQPFFLHLKNFSTPFCFGTRKDNHTIISNKNLLKKRKNLWGKGVMLTQAQNSIPVDFLLKYFFHLKKNK